MNDRILAIAETYAANAGEVDKLAAAIADLVENERQASVRWLKIQGYPELARSLDRDRDADLARRDPVKDT
jgi:hypothetical protein